MLSRRRPLWWFMLLVLLLLLVSIVSLVTGKYPLTLGELWQSLITAGRAETNADMVLWNLRLPRLLAGILVGASLAVAGASYQAMFKNPLVSPDILGVSAGAGLGAVFAIFLSLPLAAVQLFAFVGGLMAVALVYLISLTSRQFDSTLVLVLAGVAIGSLLGAGISLIKILADPYSQLATITFWLLGGLNAVSKSELLWALPFMLLGLLPLILLRWRINLLSLSDMEAQALGVNTGFLRFLLIICATLMTAAAVSFTGIIGWIGLVIPHVARLLVGPEFSRLLPSSLLIGAVFLVLTDNVARNAASIELPLGVLTSLIGAPFFLYLLLKGRSHG
ncbi:Probable ABC transporter permease protein HI_1471 [Oligella ureolytica]|uniref:Iron ABC transporter permease n=1 Tax=Oligella ureolytica TaxID=90244 RepID=A0A378XHU7_9BURK|nr:iron ABC transporter permease [Oligella ureolytica]QPT39489.1 iron ABC transporter permease [Oligella ureolytica]SUA56393.1 Probable ABC transporter permease protein HI_1471 [Oligella ureolytica]